MVLRSDLAVVNCCGDFEDCALEEMVSWTHALFQTCSHGDLGFGRHELQAKRITERPAPAGARDLPSELKKRSKLVPVQQFAEAAWETVRDR
jgi:hypothetical protein